MEMVKNLREQVAWCQRRHPVTHYYDCAGIVEKYLKLVKVGRRAFPFFLRGKFECGVVCRLVRVRVFVLCGSVGVVVWVH